MYKRYFGSRKQMTFNSRDDYYEFLGFLANNNNKTSLTWENNEDQGAWGSEGRIQLYVEQPDELKVKLKHTAGTGNIVSRVNCNEYLSHIVRFHSFQEGSIQDVEVIRNTIRENDLDAFDRGLQI